MRVREAGSQSAQQATPLESDVQKQRARARTVVFSATAACRHRDGLGMRVTSTDLALVQRSTVFQDKREIQETGSGRWRAELLRTCSA